MMMKKVLVFTVTLFIGVGDAWSCQNYSNDQQSAASIVLDAMFDPSGEGYFLSGIDGYDGGTEVSYGVDGSIKAMEFLQSDSSAIGSFASKGDDVYAISQKGEVFLISNNNQSWTPLKKEIPESDDFMVNSVAIIKDHFVVAGLNSVWSSSINANEMWKEVVSGTGNFDLLSSKVQNSNLFIRGSDLVLISSNGYNWLPTELAAEEMTVSIIWDGDKYVAISESGSIQLSDDGVRWRSVDSELKKGVIDAIWSGSIYLAVGECGSVQVSSDLKSWTSVEAHTFLDLFKIVKSSSQYLVIGQGTVGTLSSYDDSRSVVLLSNDGITWEKQSRK